MERLTGKAASPSCRPRDVTWLLLQRTRKLPPSTKTPLVEMVLLVPTMLHIGAILHQPITGPLQTSGSETSPKDERSPLPRQ
jgi:hypothetical protein